MQGLISIKQGTGQMSWTLIKGTGQGPVITMFMKRGVPDIVLEHEKCIGLSVKVPGKCPLSGMDISPCACNTAFNL